MYTPLHIYNPNRNVLYFLDVQLCNLNCSNNFNSFSTLRGSNTEPVEYLAYCENNDFEKRWEIAKQQIINYQLSFTDPPESKSPNENLISVFKVIWVTK